MKLKECAPISNTKIADNDAKKEIVLSLICLFKKREISNEETAIKAMFKDTSAIPIFRFDPTVCTVWMVW